MIRQGMSLNLMPFDPSTVGPARLRCRLQIAEDLGLADKHSSKKVELPFLGYRKRRWDIGLLNWNDASRCASVLAAKARMTCIIETESSVSASLRLCVSLHCLEASADGSRSS